MNAKSGNCPLRTQHLLILVTILRHPLALEVWLGEGDVMKKLQKRGGKALRRLRAERFPGVDGFWGWGKALFVILDFRDVNWSHLTGLPVFRGYPSEGYLKC